MSEEEPDQLTQDLEEQVEKLTFKEPKKRVLSQDALEKLKKARVAALAVRKANYEKKLKAKADLSEAKLRTKIAKEETKSKKKEDLDELVDTAEKELIESKKKNAIEPDSEEEASVIKKAKSKKPKSKKTRIVIANNSDSSSSDDDTPQIYIRTKKKKKSVKAAPVVHEDMIKDYMPTVPIQEVQEQHHHAEPPQIERQNAQPYWMSFR